MFSDEQIRLGYEKAILDNREFVPNLSVLIHYIAGDGDWESKRLHKDYDPNQPLIDLGEGRLLEAPKDERSPEEHMAAMRKKLGIG